MWLYYQAINDHSVGFRLLYKLSDLSIFAQFLPLSLLTLTDSNTINKQPIIWKLRKLIMTLVEKQVYWFMMKSIGRPWPRWIDGNQANFQQQDLVVVGESRKCELKCESLVCYSLKMTILYSKKLSWFVKEKVWTKIRNLAWYVAVKSNYWIV